jgi:hypothetical protein
VAEFDRHLGNVEELARLFGTRREYLQAYFEVVGKVRELY